MPESQQDKPSRRLLVVSNRLPVRVERTGDGFSYEPVAGGLATSLESVRQMEEMLWLGWPGVHVRSQEARREIERKLEGSYDSIPLFLPKAKFDRYYEGFSNGTIWPLFHYFPQNAHYDAAEWESYKAINAQFRKKIVEIAQPGDRLWIHDYHLLLLPQMVRESLPDIRIGFFLHIPFPSSELFRMLPWREEVLRGLLGADLIGFHSFSYARHFLSSLLRLLGLEQEFGEILVGERRVRIDTFPLGVDVNRFTSARKSKTVRDQLEDLRETTQGRKVVLTVDRLDFSKGIPRRLHTFEHFLETHPEWHGRVTLISLIVPSRTGVPEYQTLKREVDELVGRINGRFGQPGWAPIWYLYRFLPFERLAALYELADVALVTPLRDGMNLVAKEYLAARPDGTGVLVLSETAGAAEELGEALIVNPHDTQGMSDALLSALEMPIGEQKRRNAPMLARLRRYDVAYWAEDFLQQLDATAGPEDRRGPETLEGMWIERLRSQYDAAKHRLLLLDYDGTLVPFAPRPGDAMPDPELVGELRTLASDEKNTVVVISGRDRDTLEGWMGEIGAALVAEHGAQIQDYPNGSWRQGGVGPQDDWQDQLRPLLEVYVDRTPGAMLEEKTASLAWHYRRAEPELGALRAKELMENLEAIVANTPLVVLQGEKVVEVKQSGIGKGKAAERWLSRDPPYDFILAIGDDATDEEMFEVLPETAWTVKVRQAASSTGRFFLPGPEAVRRLLRELASRR